MRMGPFRTEQPMVPEGTEASKSSNAPAAVVSGPAVVDAHLDKPNGDGSADETDPVVGAV